MSNSLYIVITLGCRREANMPAMIELDRGMLEYAVEQVLSLLI